MADNCPFCDIRQFKERLIAEVDGFYVIATLGQITNSGYVLIIPKRHVPCIGAMEEPELKALSDVLHTKVRPAFENEYPPDRMMFEHGIVGQTVQHAHLHILPGRFRLSPKIDEDFPIRAYERDVLCMSIPLVSLGVLYRQKQKPYLLWKDESTLWYETVCWDPPAPPQYLRTLTAEALGRPERANWRTMDPELDRRLWSETVRRLKPYFS